MELVAEALKKWGKLFYPQSVERVIEATDHPDIVKVKGLGKR